MKKWVKENIIWISRSRSSQDRTTGHWNPHTIRSGGGAECGGGRGQTPHNHLRHNRTKAIRWRCTLHIPPPPTTQPSKDHLSAAASSQKDKRWKRGRQSVRQQTWQHKLDVQLGTTSLNNYVCTFPVFFHARPSQLFPSYLFWCQSFCHPV